MKIPQIIILILIAISLLVGAYQHGTKETKENNFFVHLISNGIVFSLLYWGGFFN